MENAVTAADGFAVVILAVVVLSGTAVVLTEALVVAGAAVVAGAVTDIKENIYLYCKL